MRIRTAAVLSIIVLVACLPLESRNRDEAARLVEALALGPRATVAEIGAGKGDLTVALARELGGAATIFTTELESELPALRRAAEGRQNVRVVEALPDDANLPESCCDAIVLKRVYHHFQKPALNNASMFRALKEGGALAVIDFPPRAGWKQPDGTPHRGGHGVSIDHLTAELAAAGFESVRVEDEWNDGMFLAIFRRP